MLLDYEDNDDDGDDDDDDDDDYISFTLDAAFSFSARAGLRWTYSANFLNRWLFCNYYDDVDDADDDYDDDDDGNDDDDNDDDDEDDVHWFGRIEMLPDGGSHDDQRFADQVDNSVL